MTPEECQLIENAVKNTVGYNECADPKAFMIAVNIAMSKMDELVLKKRDEAIRIRDRQILNLLNEAKRKNDILKEFFDLKPTEI